MNAKDNTPFAITANPDAMPADKRAALIEDPGFGRVFTDHMALVRWKSDTGWHDAQISARKPFQLDPACLVLHYAQEIFEGMKAYRTASGGVALFRPDANAHRFAESAKRLAMPPVPEALFLGAIDELVRIDAAWIPGGEGSLYIRPFMFADEAFLGVRPSSSFIFCIIASPVGAYFKGGKRAVTVWVSDDYTRAARGGTGAAKCGGNYAAGLIAQATATAQGCDQVVFLDAVERKWIEELGGMNVFFVMKDGALVTPPLSDTILHGVTRDSLIQIARAQGLAVNERPYSIDEWRSDAASGKLAECFACGTAAVVTSIGQVKSRAGGFTIGSGEGGPVTDGLKEALVGIQRGTAPDRNGWVHPVRL